MASAGRRYSFWRSFPGRLTGKERAILVFLGAALLWGAVGGAREVARGRAAAAGERADLYRELRAALPDPDFARDRSGDDFRPPALSGRSVHLTRPPLPGEPELEVSEERWIFFPRDYHTTVNINKAGFDELVTLPGIGPVTAWRIIRYRQRYVGFSRVKALKRIPGIGEKTLEKLEGKIRLY